MPPGLHLDVQGNHAESTGSSGCDEDSLQEVLESLRLLFYMLFTMTREVQPEECFTEAEMTRINHLVAEVRSQKAKITELRDIIQKRFLQSQSNPSGPTSSSPVNSATMGLEV